MNPSESKPEYFNTIVIGGGQAGLSVGYFLARKNVSFVILDAGERVGDSWRKRWDSLRLFTPAIFSGIAGKRFPAPPYSFPTKDQMADYLEGYAKHFGLPVRTGFRVDRLAKKNGRFIVTSGDVTLEADNVVVAMATYQSPRIPSFAKDLDPSILQLHSLEYRNPSQVRDGGVLIVGAGNSGAEIAMDLSRSHATWMSGRDVGHIPFNTSGLAARLLLMRFLFRFVFHRVLTVNTPMGRKSRKKLASQGSILIRIKPGDLAAAGVQRVPRVAGVRDGKPVLNDGKVLEVANIIWCTGFHPGFQWIDLPVFDNEEPRHYRGVVQEEPGLFFLGLQFLYSFSSTMIHGVERDAEYIADAVVSRNRNFTVPHEDGNKREEKSPSRVGDLLANGVR